MNTLPQDKIFSVLSIAARSDCPLANPYAKSSTTAGREQGAEQRLDLTLDFPAIDYTKATSLVYQDFVKHTINLEKNLDCLAILQDRSTIGSDLPSWAIDLRVDVPRSRFRSPKYKTWPERQDRRTWSEQQDFGNHGVLVVKGLRLGVFGSTMNPADATFSYDLGFKTDASVEDCLTQLNVSHRTASSGSAGAFKSTVREHCKYSWRKGTVNEPLSRAVQLWCLRQYGTIPSSSFALVSDLVENGDLLVTLRGSNQLFALRWTPNGRYLFLGPVMLYGGEGAFHRGWYGPSEDEIFPGIQQHVAIVKDESHWRASQGMKDYMPEDFVEEFLLV